MTAVGVFGGTFDPVHNGHLRAALEVLQSCGLSGMRLVPAGAPPHRGPPVATPEERLGFLRAAVAAEPRLSVDDRELRRAGPSYTVDTLSGLREELPGQTICLVLGADAFAGLAGWHRWRELLGLAHIIVIHRPGARLAPAGELAALMVRGRCDDPAQLRGSRAGLIHVQPVTQLDISSSAIRGLLQAGGDPRYLVPDPVRDLLMTSRCYRTTAAEV